jgi:hypothetical protein
VSGGFGTCKYCGCCTDGGRDVCSDCYIKDDIVDRITAVQTAHERTGPPLKCACGGREHYRCVCYTHEECECGVITPYDTHAAHVAERVAAELPRFGEIREAYEFYQLDSDKAMAAQIFAQQVGEILEAES